VKGGGPLRGCHLFLKRNEAEADANGILRKNPAYQKPFKDWRIFHLRRENGGCVSSDYGEIEKTIAHVARKEKVPGIQD
ncbi:MAG: hypothetical protein ACQESG_08215, partial [Nanobdellota archaeon]